MNLPLNQTRIHFKKAFTEKNVIFKLFFCLNPVIVEPVTIYSTVSVHFVNEVTVKNFRICP
jgi:hypothetical protein